MNPSAPVARGPAFSLCTPARAACGRPPGTATVVERPPSPARDLDNSSGPPVEVEPLARHVLSREQQQLYRKLADGVVGEDADFRAAALGGVAQDPGLHQLVPYFVEFIQEKIRENLRSVTVLLRMIAFIKNLLKNPNIFLEPYVRPRKRAGGRGGHASVKCVMAGPLP